MRVLGDITVATGVCAFMLAAMLYAHLANRNINRR